MNDRMGHIRGDRHGHQAGTACRCSAPGKAPREGGLRVAEMTLRRRELPRPLTSLVRSLRPSGQGRHDAHSRPGRSRRRWRSLFAVAPDFNPRVIDPGPPEACPSARR